MSTKIIHILKNDKARDILEDFKKTDAKEVILIFPNKSVFGQKENNFMDLKKEAEKSQKNVIVLAAEPYVKYYAEKNNFQFIDIPVKPKPSGSDIEPQRIEEIEEAPHDENIHKEEPPYPEDEKPEEDKEGDDFLPDIDPVFPENNAETEEHKIRGELAIKKYITDIVSGEKNKSVTIKGGRAGKENINISAVNGSPKDENQELEDIWLNKKDIKPKILRRGEFGKNLKKNWFVYLGISALTVFLVVYSTFVKASVTVIPKTENINLNLKISASSRYSRIDAAFNAIPGEYFSLEVLDSTTSQATGQKEVAQKASGDITIFNDRNISQILVATTRFESPEGLIFRIPNTITIPANGNIASKVFADQAGETYNIGPSNFTVPGLKGRPSFDEVYAKSVTSMRGGIVGLANVVTEQDLNKAKDELSLKISEKIKREFNKSLPNLEITGSIEPKIVSEEVSHKIDEAATEFTVNMKAEIKTVAFKKEDLLDLAEKFIQKTGNLILLRDNVEVNYGSYTLNDESETLEFDVNIKGVAGTKIDNFKLVQALSGQDQGDIGEILSLNEIEEMKISLTPFWINKIPKNPERINIKVQY